MPNVLIYTTRSIKANQTVNLLRNLGQAKRLGDLTLFSNDVTESNRQYVSNLLPLSGYEIGVTRQYGEIMKAGTPTSWQEIYDQIDVSRLKKYDKIVMCCGLLYKVENLFRGCKHSTSLLDRKTAIRAPGAGAKIANFIALYKAHKELGIEFHDMVWDPDELSPGQFTGEHAMGPNYHMYHGYDIPRYGMKRLDSVAWLLNESSTDSIFDQPEKDIDFTFGATFSLSKRRKFMKAYQDCAEHFENKQLFIHDGKTDGTIGRDAYMSKIARSRFTFVIPAYDVTCMSIYRIQESLASDCLPLIHDACQMTELEQSFNVDLKPLVYTGTIPSEQQRLEMLEHYKGIFLSGSKEFYRD